MAAPTSAKLLALTFLLLLGAELAGCAAIQPCDSPARQSTGACTIGRNKDNS